MELLGSGLDLDRKDMRGTLAIPLSAMAEMMLDQTTRAAAADRQ